MDERNPKLAHASGTLPAGDGVPLKRDPRRLIEITRHVVGPPRRCVGARLRLTPEQIAQQGLTRADYRLIRPARRPRRRDPNQS